jgi:hyperosmotically inducible protein
MGFLGPGTANAVPYQAPDAWITAKAKLSLWTSAGIRSSAVKIDTSEGTVTLYGKVDSATQKKEANKLILGIEGVKHVQDLLQIAAPSDAKAITIADEKITTEVNRALKREPALARSTVTVQSVDKGVVLLTGTAETMSDQLLAFLVADSVDGVRRVVTEIKAPERFMPVESKKAGQLAKASKSKLTTSANDMRITTEIKLRFLADNNTPALSISVDTNRSRVSLFGTVASPEQSDRAKSVAQQVGGVTFVQNYLQVVPETKQELAKADDAEIKSTIAKFLQGQPEFKSVDVSVIHGTVHLAGSVPSSWDRLRAALISRSTPGARSVEDELIVE